jgi:hypothetical protein
LLANNIGEEMAQNPSQGPGSANPLYDLAVTANPRRDNGATVLMGGAIDSSPTVTNAPDTAITGAGRKEQPKPQANAQTGAQKANSAGVFAVLAAGQYIVKGGNITTQLAGVAYRGLRGAGNQNQIVGIHTLLTRRTVLIDSWDYATGAATFNASNPSIDDFGAAALAQAGTAYSTPTRALPGNVVITDFDGLDPTTVALPAKTG